MHLDKTLLLLIGIVLAVIAAWTLFLLHGLGYENILSVLKGNRQVRIGDFGQLGASYGILASVFAGFAIVLLWQNIRVQQKELSELKRQMEHDRTLSSFLWILDNYKEIRSSLAFSASGRYELYQKGDTSIGSSERGEVVCDMSSLFREARLGGDYVSSLDGDQMKAIFIDRDGDNAQRLLAAVEPAYQCAIDIAGSALREIGDVRHRLLRLAWSVLTSTDLLVIHELCLFENDKSSKDLFTRASFFGGLDEKLVDEILEGPCLPEAAYGRLA